MKFHLEHTFSAPLDAVEAAMVNPEFLESTRLPDVGPPEVLSRQENGDIVTLRVSYHYTGSLDSLARRVLRSGDVSWVQETKLDRSTHRTTFTVMPKVHADRFQCGGAMQVTQAGEATTQRVIDGELKIKVPLFGNRAEGLILPGLRSRMQREAELLDEWLKAHPAG
ncbi:MAG: DUF2505 domain-containing protein [Acidimicrobiia bacterium]|nr:DUF2505 domain-containing protein [Acidimicrobiia bacterium]MBV9041603.1 DUF2505 domain-containing protein [Acidimicrobiia bacterium]